MPVCWKAWESVHATRRVETAIDRTQTATASVFTETVFLAIADGSAELTLLNYGKSLFLKKSALLHVRALDNAQAAQDATRLFFGPNLETCTVNVFYESVISRK